MKLFGTTTSPFVRRVRVVADETGQVIELINTATDVGQAKLREVAPIRKVPVAVMDGRTLFDSHVIIDWIFATRGWHDMAPPRDPWIQHNIVNAIDAAIDAAIQLFYLRRDGVAVDGSPYELRQVERVDAIFAWLATQVEGGRTLRGGGGGFGLAELALVSALDWMDFRKTYKTEGHDVLNAVRATWRERTSLAATRPHV
jgi:glutathione S-transferase